MLWRVLPTLGRPNPLECRPESPQWQPSLDPPEMRRWNATMTFLKCSMDHDPWKGGSRRLTRGGSGAVPDAVPFQGIRQAQRQIRSEARRSLGGSGAAPASS
jgi:hypothetical protein